MNKPEPTVSSTAPKPKAHSRLRLRISPTAESIVRSGHPWVYAQSIRGSNRPGTLGDLAVIYDRKDQFLAVGLYDPFSPLRLRVLHSGKPQPIDRAWWKARLHEAASCRTGGVFDDQTTGFRWIHGESDGWPGLVLDRYGHTLVAKLYTAAWLPHWPVITGLLQEEFTPERLVLRLSRNIQSLALEQFQAADGQVVLGPPLYEPVRFLETGLWFEADVLRGQKTGFFLDQRENRRRVEALSKGRSVLNVFSFSGGFSLYAARGGALSVTDLDISAHALEAARRNFSLNQAIPAVRDCPQERVQADAFEWLDLPAPARFDLIVLDPPSLAKREAERSGALQAYRRLVGAALSHLRPGGILVAASCSAHVSAAEFFAAMREAAHNSRRPFVESGTWFHPPDHPARFPEAEYLKSIYLQFEGS